MKAIVPENFPERAFSTEYALTDLSYALELAADAGIEIRGAELTGRICRKRSMPARAARIFRRSPNI
jgi:3-hydroxyisobutyrate dehydrogenase